MYELWSGIPMGLGTPIKNIGASLSVKSAEVGKPKKCAEMGKPSGCHEFICLLSLFVAYCILVFACNEVFVFAADQRERFVCWRLIPAPFSFPHHHIVIRPATTAHICWILTMYYNMSIDIVMLLLNVDPETPCHSHIGWWRLSVNGAGQKWLNLEVQEKPELFYHKKLMCQPDLGKSSSELSCPFTPQHM